LPRRQRHVGRSRIERLRQLEIDIAGSTLIHSAEYIVRRRSSPAGGWRSPRASAASARR
jgi:hypothetical protein